MKPTLFILLILATFTLYGQTEVDFLNKGNSQLQYQNYEEAKSLLTQAISLKPDFADAYALRGDCNYYLKAYDQAIADYEKDHTLKKDRSSYSLACTYALVGKKDLAFKSLEANLSSEYKIRMSHIIQDKDLETLRSDPRWEPLTKKQWYSAYENLLNEAEYQSTSGDLTGAIVTLTKAIDLNPSDSRAYGNRALIYLRTENMSSALEDMDQAVKLSPDKSVYYGNRGYVNNKLQNTEASLADYEKAVALDPANLVYYDLGLARYMSGNKAGALNALRKHISYYNRDQMGYYFGGIIASETELFPEALEYYNQALQIDNAVPQIFMKRGDVYFLMKKYQEAINDYNSVISLDPSFSEAYYIRGNAKASMLDKGAACQDWRKAVELGFEDSNGYIRDLCN